MTNNIETTIISISPDEAKKLLSQNMKAQRNLSPKRVQKYAMDMAAGEWTLGDAIKFDTEERLVDGQHRLAALIKAGVTLDFLVIKNFPKEGIANLDTGYARTPSAVAAVQGVSMSNAAAAVVKALFLFNPVFPPTKAKDFLHHRDVVRLYLEHQDRIDFATQSFGAASRRYSGVRSVVARAWAYADEAKLKRFIEVWDTRMSLCEEEFSIVRLRTKYDDTVGKAGSALVGEFSRLTHSALKAYLEGRSVKAIVETHKNLWPFPEFDLYEPPKFDA